MDGWGVFSGGARLIAKLFLVAHLSMTVRSFFDGAPRIARQPYPALIREDGIHA
jgi:hypothetical protein